MDAPLLALTTRAPASLPGGSPSAVATQNMRQLIQLRWIAVAGQLLAILVARFALGLKLPLAPMLGVVAGLALANVLFAVTLRRRVVRGEVASALLLDMAALTALLYFSGGSDNPFISLYLVQVVLGAILLPPAAAGLLTLVACGCYAFLGIAHRPLVLADRDLMLLGSWLAFAMVAVLLVLFIARISRNLRARDAFAAEQAKRATEEEGIIRMGLFASGAAHELGTPLSSLSVLIADWQRMPVFEEAGLAQELGDAGEAIGRCKAIVSNILHSAGQSRGEAMASVSARALVADIAETWAVQHPGPGFAASSERLGQARIAAEPALRQAIWSLLDNAFEASRGDVRLDGAIDGERVVIAVSDSGPGFEETQLRSVGQLYHSTKGPGHGLGLFLAANVARQLGGSLEVANRDGGGAVARLILPLVGR
jgi:two-component system sensor histidine kinase RegB